MGNLSRTRRGSPVFFDAWRETHEPVLKGLEIDANPKDIIRTLAEDMLARFADLPLLDPYNVYQRLMDYWDEAMQDDVYLITADGWTEAAKPRGIIEDKEKKIKETPDLTIKRRKYKMDLIPPALMVARYFADEQAAVEVLQAKQEAAARELEEFVEEHTGEEGLLEDAVNDKGKVTKGGVTERLKVIRFEPESDEESDALKHCRTLIEGEAEAAKAVKEAQARLDEQVLARYGVLTEAEIKTLAVEDKWFTSIRAAVQGEVQRPDSAARRAGEGTGRALRPSAAGVGAGGGGVWREGRGALEADGDFAMSRKFDFENLVELFRRTHEETQRSAARTVDSSDVARNYLFGWYIVEYEQHGVDRAEYGSQLLGKIASRLQRIGIKGSSETRLKALPTFLPEAEGNWSDTVGPIGILGVR